MNKVFVGDTGTLIILNCGQDVSAATSRTIEVRKPNGSVVSWSAQLSGLDSLSYLSTVNTFTMPGRWRLQAKVTMPNGVWLGETVILDVFPAFG